MRGATDHEYGRVRYLSEARKRRFVRNELTFSRIRNSQRSGKWIPVNCSQARQSQKQTEHKYCLRSRRVTRGTHNALRGPVRENVVFFWEARAECVALPAIKVLVVVVCQKKCRIRCYLRYGRRGYG